MQFLHRAVNNRKSYKPLKPSIFMIYDVLRMNPHEELIISKLELPSLGADFQETTLGDPQGAIRQFRGQWGIHVREHSDCWIVHRDNVDPRNNPLGHLLEDVSPLSTAICGGIASEIFPKHKKDILDGTGLLVLGQVFAQSR